MKKSLVILGAGYGGLLTAVKLEEKAKRLKDVEIVLVDRNDYHQYLHLAYEIVTGVKKVSDLTIPLSELLKKRKIRFLQASVYSIDFADKLVRTDKGDLPYWELVIALGSEPNYCHIKGAEEHSFCVSSVEAAAQIRDNLKKTLAQKKKNTIVVGGGGFTGVELAGEIVDEHKCCVTIIEGSKTLLPTWNIPEFSRKVANVLTEMGAKLILGKFIAEVKQDTVVLNDGSQVECSLFIWTGGVQGSHVTGCSGMKTEKGNRVKINEFCEAVGFPGVYVVGDCALVVDPKTGETLPQCVEIALQQAEVVAQNLYADVTKNERTVYIPKFSGLILAVGEKYGIGKISGVKVEGRLAQTIKTMIHLRYVYEIAGLGKVLKEAT
ncbi:MAG: FAD-dependent oxidoreductase [Candidatus Bathyarchaeia archaeon]